MRLREVRGGIQDHTAHQGITQIQLSPPLSIAPPPPPHFLLSTAGPHSPTQRPALGTAAHLGPASDTPVAGQGDGAFELDALSL